MKTTYHHRLRWIVNEKYKSVFHPYTLNHIINLENIQEHRIVRTLSSRTVRYLKPSSPEIPALYLKEYHLPTLLDGIKNLFLSPAEREWCAARKISKRNVSTFTPLAVGKLKQFGLLKKNYLISKSIEDARSIKEYLFDCDLSQTECRADEKIKATVSLAKFVKDLHQKGIFHQDFHWENILAKKGEQGTINFYLMDLHRIKLKSKLTDKEKIKNLASLNTGFYQKVRKTERLRFLKTYAEGDKKWEKDCHSFARLIEEMTDKMTRKKWRKRDKRCFRQNKYFASFKSSTCKGFVNRDFCNPELLDLLKNPDLAFSESASSIIKDSHTTSSCFLPLKIAGEKGEIHIKRYNYQNIFYALKNLFRTSRAKRVWKTANSLVSRSIPTPSPVCFLEERKWRLLIKSFFISLKIDQSLSLNALLQEGLSGTSNEAPERKNALIQQVANMVREMHDRDICHGDLKSNNILVEKKAGKEDKPYLVDLDSARIKKGVKKEDRIRDLARLNASLLDTKIVSTPDRLRFLKHYLNVVEKKGEHTVSEYWKEIVCKTQKKLKKSGRKFTTCKATIKEKT